MAGERKFCQWFVGDDCAVPNSSDSKQDGADFGRRHEHVRDKGMRIEEGLGNI